MSTALLPESSAPSYLPSAGAWSDLAGRNDDSYLEGAPKSSQAVALLPEEIRTPKHFRPIVVLFMGRRGQGKTLVMTALAHAMQRRYRAGRQSRKILSNYGIDFADLSHPLLADSLANQWPSWAEDSWICIDEIVSAFPNRRSLAGLNVRFSQFLTQVRKFRSELAFATQFPQALDKQMLWQVDLFVRCELIHAGRGVQLYVYDYWGQWTGKDYTKPWPPRPGEHDWELSILNTHLMFGHYNSNEIVVPAFLDNRDELLGRYWEFEVPQEEEAAEEPAPARHEPETLDEYLDEKVSTESVNVSALLAKAKHFDSRVTDKKVFVAMLKAKGYEVFMQSGELRVRLKEGAAV